jgi:hypothetical protein
MKKDRTLADTIFLYKNCIQIFLDLLALKSKE